MIKKWILGLVFVLVCFAGVDAGQIIVKTSGTPIIPAKEGMIASIKGFSILATSTTSVQFRLYSGTDNLLGTPDTLLTVDLDGIDGPAGVVFPESSKGWFNSTTTNTPVNIFLSANTKVIVILIYTYEPSVAGP